MENFIPLKKDLKDLPKVVCFSYTWKFGSNCKKDALLTCSALE